MGRRKTNQDNARGDWGPISFECKLYSTLIIISSLVENCFLFQVSVIDTTASNADNVCNPSGQASEAPQPVLINDTPALLEVAETSTLASRVFQRPSDTDNLVSVHRPRPRVRQLPVLPLLPPPYQAHLDQNNNI